MLTVFSTPKPFHGHSGIIQRNALKSWTLLHPDVEVILFGDEDGAAETCRDLGIRHEPKVQRNENGTKYLSYIFDRAKEISSHKFLCYANCDIMLASDFRAALELVSTLTASSLLSEGAGIRILRSPGTSGRLTGTNGCDLWLGTAANRTVRTGPTISAFRATYITGKCHLS